MRPPDTASAVFSAVSDMEDEVRHVRGFARILLCMGCSSICAEPKALETLGSALDDLADRLAIRFDEAFERSAEAKR